VVWWYILTYIDARAAGLVYTRHAIAEPSLGAVRRNYDEDDLGLWGRLRPTDWRAYRYDCSARRACRRRARPPPVYSPCSAPEVGPSPPRVGLRRATRTRDDTVACQPQTWNAAE